MPRLDVRVLSIHWENIRAFPGTPFHETTSAPATNGEQYQDFPKSTNIFLQMPNGTGKTTTLHLLRSVCIGRLWVSPNPTNAEEDTLGAYKRIIDDETEATSKEDGIFKTRMEINGEIYGFEIRFDHESGEAQWSTETPKGKRKGWHPPDSFSRAFRNNPRLIELFVFDAETARRVQRNTDQHILERAIRQFGGLSEVYGLVGEPGSSGNFLGGRFETVIDSLKKSLGKGGQKTKNLETVLERATEHKIKLENDLEKYRGELVKANKEIGELDDELAKFDDVAEAMDVVKELKSKEMGLDDDIDEAAAMLLSEFVNPSRIFTEEWAEIMSFHKDHQDRNLPEDVGKGWLISMSEREECLCGIEFSDETRDHFRNHIDSLLDRNKMISVSEMQTAFAESPIADRETLSAMKSRVVDLGSQLDTVRIQLESAYNEKLSEEKDALRRELNDERDKLVVQEDIIQGHLEILTSSNWTWLVQEGMSEGLKGDGTPTTTLGSIPRIENISICEAVIKNATSELAKAQGFQHLNSGLNDSRGVIGDALNQVSDEMRVTVSETATNVWKSMPAAGNESGKLRIEIENNGLFIYQGQKVRGGISGAQNVSACYSVTKAIGDLGQISFPLICDTPFAGFDLEMINPWYQNITESFDQVIGLVNTQEKNTMNVEVWGESIGENDFKATIYQLDEPAEDGGKRLQYTEDSGIFNSLIREEDKAGDD